MPTSPDTAAIEPEQRLVAGNREPIERFEREIQQTLACVGGEAPPADKPTAGAVAAVNDSTAEAAEPDDLMTVG